MLFFVLVLSSVVTSPSLTSVIKTRVFPCRSSFTLASSEVFRCHNGTDCIHFKHMCDGVMDCADGSDEDFCSRTNEGNYLQSENQTLSRSKRGYSCRQNQMKCPDGSCVPLSGECGAKPPDKTCVLPQYPSHGTYEVQDDPDAGPGDYLKYVALTMRCYSGFGVMEPDGTVNISATHEILCINGKWSPPTMPQCVRLCTLHEDPSVRYMCRPPGLRAFQPCQLHVPHGTKVDPQCNIPVYYSHNSLLFMNCRRGTWDYIAKCEPDCGRVTPDGIGLISNGTRALRGELPWHAGIYMKASSYDQICGGTLVTNNVVISAAHCFWSDAHEKLPASLYAVAVGKIHRLWKSANDTESQESDVKDIMIPERFQGIGVTLQADVAVVVLVTPFVYKAHVKPCCLSFEKNFDKMQLKNDKKGKVAGWGLTSGQGPPAELLAVVEMPYIEYKQCVKTVPRSFKQFITLDKFCAGHTDGTAVCRGDSGGGLAFAVPDQYIERYYLRGVVSAAPTDNDNECNVNTYATFTWIAAYDEFIKEAMSIAALDNLNCAVSQFQCDDGTCVDEEADCPEECSDGSCVPDIKPPSPTRPPAPATTPHIPGEDNDIAISDSVDECGTIRGMTKFILNGRPYIDRLPWHIGIYSKQWKPYRQICGGSLVSKTVVLSAAHCFWNELDKLIPASEFAAAAGKEKRRWDNQEEFVQKSDIMEVNIPPLYRGAATNFQDDISVVILKTPFIYNSYVQPVCLNFDINFDRRQLQVGKDGVVASWGPIDPDKNSGIMKVIDMPYIDVENCFRTLPASFAEYLTADKFCAGFTNGTSLCRGDGGGGLAFVASVHGVDRFYLRGIASTAPNKDTFCNEDTYVTFTKITAHETLIKEYISAIAADQLWGVLDVKFGE